MHDEQQENLDRVCVRIGRSVKKFCAERVGEIFFADDLRRYVKAEVGEVAPGSPDRILRDLRQKGELDYRVVSRAESVYEVISIREGEARHG